MSGSRVLTPIAGTGRTAPLPARCEPVACLLVARPFQGVHRVPSLVPLSASGRETLRAPDRLAPDEFAVFVDAEALCQLICCRRSIACISRDSGHCVSVLRQMVSPLFCEDSARRWASSSLVPLSPSETVAS